MVKCSYCEKDATHIIPNSIMEAKRFVCAEHSVKFVGDSEFTIRTEDGFAKVCITIERWKSNYGGRVVK